MAKGTGKTFLQRRYTNGQKVHEEMLRMISHQGYANQNHNEIFYTYQFGYNEKENNNKCCLVLVAKVEKLIVSFVSSGMENDAITLEKSLALSQEDP